jgi:hypothetical protein
VVLRQIEQTVRNRFGALPSATPADCGTISPTLRS